MSRACIHQRGNRKEIAAEGMANSDLYLKRSHVRSGEPLLSHLLYDTMWPRWSRQPLAGSSAGSFGNRAEPWLPAADPGCATGRVAAIYLMPLPLPVGRGFFLGVFRSNGSRFRCPLLTRGGCSDIIPATVARGLWRFSQMVTAGSFPYPSAGLVCRLPDGIKTISSP